MAQAEARDHEITVEIPEDMSDMIPEFMENRRNEIEPMAAALKSGDFEQIRIWGHNLAGCGAGYGFQDITDIGRAIEKAAVAHEGDEIAGYVSRLSNYLNSVKIIYC